MNFKTLALLPLVLPFVINSFNIERDHRGLRLKKAEPCEKTVKYTVTKIRNNNMGTDSKANVEIIVDPNAKTIRVLTENKKQGKVDFITTIEKIDCSLNADLSSGKAMYSGYTTRPNGDKSPAFCFVRVDKNVISFTSSPSTDPDATPISMIVEKWEILN